MSAARTRSRSTRCSRIWRCRVRTVISLDSPGARAARASVRACPPRRSARTGAPRTGRRPPLAGFDVHLPKPIDPTNACRCDRRVGGAPLTEPPRVSRRPSPHVGDPEGATGHRAVKLLLRAAAAAALADPAACVGPRGARCVLVEPRSRAGCSSPRRLRRAEPLDPRGAARHQRKAARGAAQRRGRGRRSTRAVARRAAADAGRERPAPARELAGDVSSHPLLAAALAEAGVIVSASVAAVDQLAEGNAPRRYLDSLRPPGRAPRARPRAPSCASTRPRTAATTRSRRRSLCSMPECPRRRPIAASRRSARRATARSAIPRAAEEAAARRARAARGDAANRRLTRARRAGEALRVRRSPPSEPARRAEAAAPHGARGTRSSSRTSCARSRRRSLRGYARGGRPNSSWPGSTRLPRISFGSTGAMTSWKFHFCPYRSGCTAIHCTARLDTRPGSLSDFVTLATPYADRQRSRERHHGPGDEIPVRADRHRQDGLEQQVRAPAVARTGRTRQRLDGADRRRRLLHARIGAG